MFLYMVTYDKIRNREGSDDKNGPKYFFYNSCFLVLIDVLLDIIGFNLLTTRQEDRQKVAMMRKSPNARHIVWAPSKFCFFNSCFW
jgi:hypothetical protein